MNGKWIGSVMAFALGLSLGVITSQGPSPVLARQRAELEAARVRAIDAPSFDSCFGWADALMRLREAEQALRPNRPLAPPTEEELALRRRLQDWRCIESL